MSSRISFMRYHINQSKIDNSPQSLATLNDKAAHPPQRIQRFADTSKPPLVLYIFKVPGRLDLCLSTVRPGADVVTDIDIAASLYYVRITNEGDRINMILVRRNPAVDGNKEIAQIFDPPGHIDVFEREYADIEPRYWKSNTQDHLSLQSTFGCYLRFAEDKISMSSPWAGVCHFSSAKMGNAVKAIHSLRHFEGSLGQDEVPVSELRFNFLPSANSSRARMLAKRVSVPVPLILPGQSDGSFDDKHIKRRSVFSRSTEISPALVGPRPLPERLSRTDPSHESLDRPVPRISRKPLPSNSSLHSANSESNSPVSPVSKVDSLETAAGLDLSLGKEKLGGGFDGEQAKLAKLIIEPEGEKMLDLLVAANILLFRRAFAAVSM